MITDKENIKDTIKRLIALIWLISVFIIIGLGIVVAYNAYFTHTSSPVEEIHKIDSVGFENNKLVTEINNLDSIKNNKIDEAKKLNNDSTLGLFYKLIGTK